MATWEEMLNGTYNPVNAVNERHQQLLNQRQAANIQRMQAANPGFQVGGYGNQAPMNFSGPMDFGGPVQYNPAAPSTPTQFQPLPQPQAPTGRPPNQFNPQGVTPFNPPSVSANQDEWLKSQFDLAGEHLGGIGDPEAAAAVAAQAGGPIGGGQGGASDGPGGNNTNSENDSGWSYGNFIDEDSIFGILAPGVVKAINGFTANQNALVDKNLEEAFNPYSIDDQYGFMNPGPPPPTNQEIEDSMFNFGVLTELEQLDEDDLSRVIDNAPGVGLGGASDNSGFGGAGGEAVSEGSQGAMGNEGPGNDGTGGQSSGGDDNDGGGRGGDGGSGGGGSSSGGPGSGTGGPR